MKKTLFITSALAVLAATPAMAVTDTLYGNEGDANASNNYTAQTYDESCTVGVTGVSEPNQTALTQATYEARVYSCAAGQNLKAASSWAENYISNAAGACETTAQNYYSVGFNNHTYTDTDYNTPFGKTACPSPYTATLSTGSTAVTDCYRACTAADTVQGADSIADGVTSFAGYVFANAQGTDDGVNTCAPASASDCATGYTFVAADAQDNTYGKAYCKANTLNISWQDEDGNQLAAGTCTYDGTLTTPADEPTKTGYTFKGWKFVTTAAQPAIVSNN